MQKQIDSSRQLYVEIENVRVTVRRPSPDKDWAGTGRYLGFRASKGEGGGLMMGSDLPIRSTLPDEDILDKVGDILVMINSSPVG